MRFLFLVFIIVPIIEITVLINVGEMIGTWNTVGLVLLSAFIGVNMLRYQGISTLTRAQAKMNAGEMPANEMVEGIILAVGGALLVTPGFVTDVIGFCCLIPITRKLFVGFLKSRFTVVAAGEGGFYAHSGTEQHDPQGPSIQRPSQGGAPKDSKSSGNTYEGEFHRDE